MKKNISSKQKKIILGLVVSIGLAGMFIALKENNMRNAHSVVISNQLNIQYSIVDKKELLNEVADSIKKSDIKDAKFIQLESAIKAVEDTNYIEDKNINENISKLDKFNLELDKAIQIYNSDENLKKDVVLANKMEEIEGLNKFIDQIMYTFNKVDVKEYNESISGFPANIIAKIKELNTVNNFRSINQ